ncbi:ROK family protein [Alkaliphilus peptidifermentans]|uniref:ROK family protein n=1 Tax=Alkaliphilus peptidifermentans DSM 18978 TaxID=1120976 RepID=A0A1G5AAK7_9FIRM|nr:ROK family protein [Alkaliphilus peptidifermentans]SCX74919.1 ROK family protein [Alkaliphilus peptidifermentans DSM 18978]
MLSSLKIQNIKNIATKLLSSGQATKMELVLSTDLSNTTVSDCINSLLKLGLVATVGWEDSIGGRRSSIYEINRNFGVSLGIMLYEQDIEIAIADAGNIIIDHLYFKITDDEPPINSLIRAIEKVIERYHEKNLLSIGIGLDGVIDYENQIVIECKSYKWNNVHLKEIIERHFLTPAYIDHRINGAAYYEKLMGQAKSLDNFIFMLEGIEEKVVLIIDGEISRGAGNLSGRINSMQQMLNNLVSYMQFLDITTAIIGFKSSGFKEKISSINTEKGQIITFSMNQAQLVQGLALMAQVKWFESIYFML